MYSENSSNLLSLRGMQRIEELIESVGAINLRDPHVKEQSRRAGILHYEDPSVPQEKGEGTGPPCETGMPKKFPPKK